MPDDGSSAAETQKEGARLGYLLALPIAAATATTAVLLHCEMPYLATVMLAYSAALWCAVHTRRRGAAIALGIGSLLVGVLAWVMVPTADDKPVGYLLLLVGPLLGLAFADMQSVRWSRPRLRVSVLLLMTLVVTAALWWQSALLMRARVWRAVGHGELALELALQAPPSSDPMRVTIIAEQTLGAHMALELLEMESWPWLACVPEDCLYLAPGERVEDFYTYDPELLPPGAQWKWHDVPERSQRLLLAELHRIIGRRAVHEAPRDARDMAFHLAYQPVPHQGADSRPWPPEAWDAARILQQHYLRRSQTPEHLASFRLGHLPLLSPEHCAFCGKITGPAVGVREHEDGSLTWSNGRGEVVRVDPSSRDRRQGSPRPTMPAQPPW